jgi:pyridoxal phosphate enzyme (YggS family)
VFEHIAANLQTVRERSDAACRRSNRAPDTVTLIAVSKTFSADHVRAAHAAGQLDFGENKVQEALQKQEETADIPLRWHLIGHLQTNKARKAATAFPVIHSVDSRELLGRIDAAAAAAGAAPEVLVQVDLAGEATKFGAVEAEAREIVAAALDCRAARLAGLMVLPPWSDDPEAARPFFERLRRLRDRWVAEGVSADRLAHLSMGMSHDFEAAIAEGSTMVRVGTAIFGKRATSGP